MYSEKIVKFSKIVPKNLYDLISWTLLIYICFCIVFARPFVGLSIFGVLIGELTVAGLVFISILLLIIPNKVFSNIDVKIILIIKSIIFCFFLSAFISGSSFYASYTYKTSSYIWTIAILFLGYFYISNSWSQRFPKFLIIFILPYTYLISTGNYPDNLIIFFNTYADKFQFIKAADLALGVIVVILLINSNFENDRFKVAYSFFIISIFAPVMLFNSRGSVLSLILFSFLYVFYEYKNIFKYKLFIFSILLISISLFFASTFRVYGNFDFYKDPEVLKVEYISEAIDGVVKNKDTAKVFLSFYFQDGYLMSRDSTTNWRLDIWQDVFYDLKNKEILMTGYGYKEIIPVMLDPTAPGRLGRDGLNEHVHNYFVNILARGGFLQLFLFITFYIYLIKYYKFRHGNYKILSLLLPVFILSSLDVTMEGVHFPFIFFSYLGYSLREGI
jgi:hypothetical protein